MNEHVEHVIGLVAGLAAAQRAFPNAYDAGYNAGKVGPNPANCHFCWFSSADNALEWSRGKRAAETQEAGQK